MHNRNIQDSIRNSFESMIMVGVLLGLTTGVALANGHSNSHRRLVETVGASLQVELQPDSERRGALWLDMTVSNTSEKDFLLEGGENHNGLEFHLVTEDGRTILDGTTGPSRSRLLKAGEAMNRRLDLSRHPLYFPNQGFLQQTVELQGIYDRLLADETHLFLHVSQQGDGQVLAIDPIVIPLDVPQLLNARRNFRQLYGDVETKIWDPTFPVNPAPTFTPGVVLVSFRPEVTLEEAERIVATRGFMVRSAAFFRSPTRMLSVEVPEGTEADALEAFRSLRAVAGADLERIFTIF